jgi:hypothetical protein
VAALVSWQCQGCRPAAHAGKSRRNIIVLRDVLAEPLLQC